MPLEYTKNLMNKLEFEHEFGKRSEIARHG